MKNLRTWKKCPLDEFCNDFTKVKQTNAEDDAKGRGKNHSVLFDTKI